VKGSRCRDAGCEAVQQIQHVKRCRGAVAQGTGAEAHLKSCRGRDRDAEMHQQSFRVAE
jgi:hypothetical protein